MKHAEVQSKVLGDVIRERASQDERWGFPQDGQSHTDWLAILTEEVGESAQEVLRLRFGSDKDKPVQARKDLRAEMVQVAAVAVAWIEHMDGGFL